MSEIEFLSVGDVLQIHADQVRRYGGSLGVRDHGLLESAVAQPMASFDGVLLRQDLFDLAATYLFHLVQNHPFIDGNKRVGAVAALVFLDFNSIEIDLRVGELYDLTIRVAQGNASVDAIANELRNRSPSR